MSDGFHDPTELLTRALEGDRIHSAYLISGPEGAAREAAERFARGLVCGGSGARPCDDCTGCRRSLGAEGGEPVAIDGTGKRGPLYRHIGDHPDLLWTERDADSTRVRIGQIRALQAALRLGANEGGWRAAVVADAEWLNIEAQNALLRLLEEPPDRTCILLVAESASGLLATIRSRCQRVRIPAPPPAGLRDAGAPEEVRALAQRFDEIGRTSLPHLLDWAEEYRGARALAAEHVQALLEVGSAWLHERACESARGGSSPARADFDAYKTLSHCRRDLVQRNANPQMVAERALIAVRRTVVR